MKLDVIIKCDNATYLGPLKSRAIAGDIIVSGVQNTGNKTF